tara:strand:- start:1524 stop:2012 length:489 start_codon:yes stop_codon:yes gene_type:complete
MKGEGKMSKIASLMATETVVDVEFPDIEGFIISLVYLNREDLVKIRNQSLTFKFNKRTRQREEEIDNDKFLAAYTEKAIKNWKGLKVKHLPMLLPVDISSMDSEENIEYSVEEARDLVTNSTIFDQFITDTMNEFEQFSITKKETDEKNSQTTSVASSKTGG